MIRRALAGAALLLAPLGLAARPGAAPFPGTRELVAAQAAPAAAGATDDNVKAACGICHAVPPPEILPRAAWRAEIARMMLIRDGKPEPVGPVGLSTRMVLLSDDLVSVLRYYQQRAPEQLPAATPWPDADSRGFAVHGFTPAGAPPLPAISHVRALDLAGNGTLEIVGSDMRQGLMVAGRATDPSGALRVIAQIPNPSNFQLFDFDSDGRKDLLVADLGSFQPEDHLRGAVEWLRRTPAGRYAPFRVEGWPRVANVEPADFNGDGKPDLAVASFGWRKVGQLAVLENTTTDYGHPSFVTHTIDPRPGSIHAIPVDMNGDGKLDLVVLFSQQFESVVVYLNTGNFTFSPQTIYTAPHPNWGSTGIEVVDLDGDGDLDVLMTHGDTFDDQILKPYHGIQWLENVGDGKFVEHALADMPGVMRAEAGDLDGDGDMDIVACAFVAQPVDRRDQPGAPSLVWLEQTSKGVFVKRTLERKPPRHATLDLVDVDGDGDLDIVVGNFMVGQEGLPWIEVWENLRKKRL